MKWKSIATAVVLAFVGACQTPSPPVDKPLPSPTRLATIAAAASDGTVVVLADRSTWIIEPDHRKVVQKWRSTDLVEAISRPANSEVEFPCVLTNQETGSQVRAKQSDDFDG